MDKFRNKYRIASNRMPGWDYSGNGIYFITMITQHRECNLGKIENKKMILSNFGKIVQNQWYKSFKIRDELFFDEFIIMPNHLHALIKLHGLDDSHVETHGRASLQSTEKPNEKPTNHVKTHGRASLQSNEQSPKPVFQRKPKSISSFIAGFKSSVTTEIDNFIDAHHLDIPKYNRNNKFWQPNYTDHIVRDENDYWQIKNYIRNNPAKWKNDKFNDKN